MTDWKASSTSCSSPSSRRSCSARLSAAYHTPGGTSSKTHAQHTPFTAHPCVAAQKLSSLDLELLEPFFKLLSFQRINKSDLRKKKKSRGLKNLCLPVGQAQKAPAASSNRLLPVQPLLPLLCHVGSRLSCTPA